jgi:hypothetical protein
MVRNCRACCYSSTEKPAQTRIQTKNIKRCWTLYLKVPVKIQTLPGAKKNLAFRSSIQEICSDIGIIIC